MKWRRHIRPFRARPALLATCLACLAMAPAPEALPPQQAPAPPALPLKVAWTAAVPDLLPAEAGVDGTAAYLRLRTPGLAAVSLADGRVSWSVATPDIVAPPATGENLVFLAHQHEVAALSARDGSPRWRRPVEGSISAPLLSASGWLMVTTDAGRAMMLRAATGDVLWTQSLAAPVRTGPVAAGRRVYVATEDGRLTSLALESGTLLWTAKLPAGATTLHPVEDRLFVGCRDRFFYCLSAENGKRKWRWRTGGPILGVTAVDAARVYFVSLDNVLRALNRFDGNQAWKAALPHRPTGGPFPLGRLLVVPGISSDVPAFNAVDGKQAGTLKLNWENSAPATFLPPEGGLPARLLVASGDGTVQLLAAQTSTGAL